MSINPSLHYGPMPSVTGTTTDSPTLPSQSRVVEGLSDLVGGLSRAWMWSALAYQDIKLRYRGSLFGPFWITLTNLVLLAAMGTIYAAIFKLDTSRYIPFLMMGLLVWQFLSTIANESCSTFTAAQDVIQQVPLPFSIQAYRTVYRNLLVLAHNAVIIPFGLILFRVPITWRVIEIVPGLLVLCINGLWISLLLGTVSARFRDVPPIVANAVQVVFFITPIFWPLDAVGDWKPLLMLSPVFAAIDVVRAPLLGEIVSPHSWPILLVCTFVGATFGLGMFIRFRERIAYWL
ncbi:MAG: ABC transporter permease, partial [Alphaproteobacteria bacterium]|nr:ABC transporter permease [Alphaproteobacteria bacterium]